MADGVSMLDAISVLEERLKRVDRWIGGDDYEIEQATKTIEASRSRRDSWVAERHVLVAAIERLKAAD